MNEINNLYFICSREIYTSERYPITKSKLFTRIKNGTFPAPMRVTNAFHWAKSDVDEFFGITG